MERVVFRGSPLAEYLEGEGEACPGWDPQDGTQEQTSNSFPAFAPRGLSDLNTHIRKKMPPSLRILTPQHDPMSWASNGWTRSVKEKLGHAENARFLEQFRYVIVASQLLDAQTNVSRYRPLYSIQRTDSNPPIRNPSAPSSPFGVAGALAVGVGAFSFVAMLYWARGGKQLHVRVSRAMLVITFLLGGLLIVYSYVRRQWLVFLRQQAVEAAARLVSHAQAFDAAAAVALSIIQDVELVSRGYRLSAPLPPISRIEERSQSRRCTKLRRTLRSSLASMTPTLTQTYTALKSSANQSDLEKYLEIYDIEEGEIHGLKAPDGPVDREDEETLRWLKASMVHLCDLRKLFLCSLLALPALSGRLDFARWEMAINSMRLVGAQTAEETEKLKRILLENEQLSLPSTPRVASTPAEERVRMQLRKLSSLSQGIRGLQAKMHVLREESEESLEGTVDVVELGSNLLAQYDSIGNDLRTLMHEWECGRATLASHIDKTGRRVSQVSGGLRSPTISLDGTTVVEGSPSDALRALNGENTSRSSTDLSGLEGEEVFEAVAAPRPRSTLTRDERIKKMKDERTQAQLAREKAQANTHMMRELESVIRLRPRSGNTRPRIISL